MDPRNSMDAAQWLRPLGSPNFEATGQHRMPRRFVEPGRIRSGMARSKRCNRQPPFLGDNSMLSTLGRDYVGTLRTRFAGRLPGGVDLVTYWFEKSLACIAAGRLQSAGLVSTQAI